MEACQETVSTLLSNPSGPLREGPHLSGHEESPMLLLHLRGGSLSNNHPLTGPVCPAAIPDRKLPPFKRSGSHPRLRRNAGVLATL